MFLSSETNVTTHPLLALSESSFLSFFHFLLSFDCDLFIMKTIFLICSFTHSIRLSRCVFGWMTLRVYKAMATRSDQVMQKTPPSITGLQGVAAGIPVKHAQT